jgi:STE24 endopeptidase
MTAAAFSTLFVLALLFSAGVRVWLTLRHIGHVAANRDAVPPAFAATISAAAHARAADYTVARSRLSLCSIAIAAAFLLALTQGGGVQWLYEAWAGALRAGSVAHGVALLGSVAVLGWAVELPVTLWRTFITEARFGFNRTTVALFVSDTLKEGLLGVLIGVPLLAAALWIVIEAGALWWLYVWAFWLAVNVLAMLIWPTFIAPLFNRFSPLDDAALKARIERLLARCSFRAKGLFVMDGSRRSAHGNAYFTGFGAAKRIVFFDTLLDKLGPEEIEAVLAHELGHFRCHHVPKRLAAMGAASLALFALLGWLMGQEWFFGGLGAAARDPAVALLLFSLVLPVFMFPFGPLMSLWSRRHEYEADAYAARQTRADDLIHALVKLYRDNAATLTPDPYYSTFHDSHPPAAMRIARLQSLAGGTP